MSPLLRRFPNAPARPEVVKAEGCYLYLKDGRKLLDASSGWCSLNVLGYSHPEVILALETQMRRFCHIDPNHWENPQLTELAQLLLSQAPKGLNRVYFSGSGGSEAVEAAMKLSYQQHFNSGQEKKTFYISREQSFHGATLQTIALSDIDIFSFYKPLIPENYVKIPLHYPLRGRLAEESLDDYARRGARDLENKILQIGSEKVAAFVGETMLGGLLGDVPPAPGYWKYIREVCDRYNVHLILDEVYCGLGRSGRIYCCDWDGITPDFVCVAKALGGGYAPLSAVITTDRVERLIKNGQGRIHGGHTYQGYSLGCAAALAIQKVVHRESTLIHINQLGIRMRLHLEKSLKQHPFFREVRGRGSLFSLEYQTPDNILFSSRLYSLLEEEYGVVVSCKWHRISFAVPFILTFAEADTICVAVVEAFTRAAQSLEKK